MKRWTLPCDDSRLLMRWVHITSVIVLVGAAYYVRRTRSAFAPEFRSTIYIAVAAAFLSGLYNFLTKASYPPGYHMWFGIKFLLGLHVLAALVLAARRDVPDGETEALGWYSDDFGDARHSDLRVSAVVDHEPRGQAT
jgi:hypothetical protein